MIKVCQKCGHQNNLSTGAELEVCPSCKAIYARVDAAVAEGKLVPFDKRVQAAAEPVAPATPTAPTPLKRVKRAQQPYIKTLRSNSNYPNFRIIVGIFAWIGYALAALLFITAFFGSGMMVFQVVSFVMAVIIAIISKVGKEAALMIADLSDAAVVIAENTSKPDADR